MKQEGYKFSGLSVLEIVGTVLFFFSLFMPWVEGTNFMGERVSESLIGVLCEDGSFSDGSMPVIISVVFCILNIILKFFSRSLWASGGVAAFALIFVMQFDSLVKKFSTYSLEFSLGVGAIFAFLAAFILIICIICGWVISMSEKAKRIPREEYKKYLVRAGIWLGGAVVVFFLLTFLVMYLSAKSTDDTNGIFTISTFSILICVTIGVGIYFPFYYLVLGLMVRNLDREETDDGEKVAVEDKSNEQSQIEDNNVDSLESSEPVEEQQEPTVVYDFELEDEDEKKKKWYIGGAAAIVIAAIACFFAFSGSSKNNPLGVQKPKWEKFVKVNESNVKLYKEADVSSAYIQFAVENCECDMPDERYVWSDDKAPRGYNVNDYDVEINTVYPVLDESDGWYRVHFGVGEIQEAYIQKTSCEEVKPEPITKKIIDKVYGNDKGAYKFVEKGEFANLFILREPFGFGVEENVSMGVLIDGCIVMPAECLCFPQESDSADVSIFNASNSSEYKLWHLNCPQNYWEETSDAEFPTAFNVNNLTESDIQKMVMALRPQGSKSSTVYYYFPTVATDRFIEFEYSFSPAAASEVEEDKAVTKYEVKNDMLMAEINGEMVNTEVDGEMGIDLFGTFDLDGDGSMECAVWVNSGGNIVNPAKVITYDVENDKFVEAGDLEYTEAPTVEDKDGKTVLLQRAGLRWILYALEDHKLKRVEDEVKMVGSVRNTIEVENIYGEDEQGDVKITQDFDGDGNDDELTFSRDLSHAGGYGQWMGLNTVVLADGTSHDLGLMAAKFNILNQTTNGMPDIIADNYLYRWDGSGYESYVWDGNNIVKGQ